MHTSDTCVSTVDCESNSDTCEPAVACEYLMTIAEAVSTDIADGAFREPPGLERLEQFDCANEYVSAGSSGNRGSWGSGDMHAHTQDVFCETVSPSADEDDEVILVKPADTTSKSKRAKERELLDETIEICECT